MTTVQCPVSFSFLLISKFCCNLTKKNTKISRIYARKIKISKKFPISLLKNGEILPGKKTLGLQREK